MPLTAPTTNAGSPVTAPGASDGHHPRRLLASPRGAHGVR
ncbi:hypothetical protein CZ771_13330 [Actinomycetales bacterium JB111]|nr:hypothetical protein CZ771_13330 [Actinomycetales bacterium JB111]